MATDVDRLADSTVYVPFAKTEKQNDGSIMVYGYASTDKVDLDKQIADPDWLKEALPEWYTLAGNIREMHQPSAVGKAKDLQFDDTGPYLAAKIIDPLAVKKVEEGVYNGFSIGIKAPIIVPDPKATKGRINGGKVIEVSVVDYPANPGSLFMSTGKFTLVKAADGGGWEDTQLGVVLVKDNPEDLATKAVWPTEKADDLPDSAFAYISPGGEKDEEGKTKPRSLRHLPYKDKEGKVDAVHVRNALARLSQTDIPDEAKAEAKKKLEAAAKEVGIDADKADKAVNLDKKSPEEMLKEMEAMMSKMREMVGAKKEEGKEEKTITTDTGLAPYNLEGQAQKAANDDFSQILSAISTALGKGVSEEVTKAAQPDLGKVGKKMSKERLGRMSETIAKFKDVAGELETLFKELGDSPLVTGEEPKPEGGGTVKATESKNANDNMGAAMKSATAEPTTVGFDAFKAALPEIIVKSVDTAVNTRLAALGLTKDTVTKMAGAGEATGAVADIAKRFNDLTDRLQKVEQMAAPASVVPQTVDKPFTANGTPQETYKAAVSDLAKRVSELPPVEREDLAKELIKLQQAAKR